MLSSFGSNGTHVRSTGLEVECHDRQAFILALVYGVTLNMKREASGNTPVPFCLMFNQE